MNKKRDTASNRKPAGRGARTGPAQRKRRPAGPRPSRPQAASPRRSTPVRGPRFDRPETEIETETPKLHKVLAQAGLGSRLQMEQVIADGRVSVNGKKAHVGQRVAGGDRIRVDGKVLAWQAEARRVRVLLYHKPAGELVTRSDPQGRPTVFERLPRVKHGKWQAVGRLDLNTEGLLLLTDSGWLANRMMHPRFGLEREYAVRVLGGLDADEQRRLVEGVMLEDGAARFSSLREAAAGDGANRWYHAVITEGRNREVRRMVEAVGYTVSRLIRVRYGPVALPRSVRRGKWLELEGTQVADLMALAQAAGPAAAEAGETPEREPARPERTARAAPARRAGPARRPRSDAAPDDTRPRRPSRGGKAAKRPPR